MFIHKISSRLLRSVAMAFVVTALSVGTMWAQNLSVTGTVKDSNGEPLPGVYVYVQGTTTGASTDVDGKYTLSAPANATLIFSSMGMKDAVLPVNNRTVINVVMEEDAVKLDDVVVVGFGSQKKANLTGAVASVDLQNSLDSRPIPDISRGLQGAVPGMTIQIGSGEVGADARIRIRGQIGSNLGGASPLILLDNVEIPSIQMVNPDDIESISVLKDAASASIYGAKAAFGVILITSKKGAETESVSVNYSGNVAFSSMAQKYEMGDVDALHYTVEAAERVGTYTPVGAFWLIDRAGYNAAVAWKEKYKNLDPDSPMTYGRDWYVDASGRKIGIRTYNPYDYLIRDAAPSHSHTLSVAGKKGSTSFNASFGYLDQEGLMKPAKHDDYRRWNANVRVSTKVNDWFTVRGAMMFSKYEKRWAYGTSGGSDNWLYVYRWGPTYPLVPTDEWGNNIRTAAYEIANDNTAYNSYAYTSVTAGTTITPVKDWNIDFDYTYATRNEIAWRPGTLPYAGDTWVNAIAVPNTTINNEWAEYNQLGSTIPVYMLNPSYYNTSYASWDHVYRSAYTSQRQTYILKSTYALKIRDNHQFNFLVGMQAVDYDQDGNWSRRYQLLDYKNPQFNFAIGDQFVGGGYSWDSQLGFFGRINYAFKDKYLLEANLRYDGSSKFPTGLKWRWFPSFSAGWAVTEEPWMKGISNVLSFLKVRGSWGKVGDQTVSSSLYIPTISSSTTSWIEPSGNKAMSFSTPAAVASDITWQDISTIDIGFDARLFRSLGIAFDWYNRETSNMIVPLEGIGYGFGTSSPNGNFGSLTTSGWELAFDYGHRFKNGLSITVNASIADAVTKIDKYGTGTIVTNWYNGKTYGEIWGYKVDRLFQKDDFVYDSNGQLVKIQKDGYTINQFSDPNMPNQGKLNSGSLVFGPGDVKFKDLNGDGLINNGDNTLADPGDRTVIGNSTPRYEYTFGVDLAYKGFDLRLFFQGIGKRQIWGDGALAIPGFNSSDGSMPQTFAEDFWYETFDSNGNVIDANYDAFYPRAANSGAAFNMVTNDRYLLNMAYLRLKNVTLGYTLPESVTRKAYIKNLRVYVSLENFLTFDHLRGLPIDPEEIPGVGYNDTEYNSSRAGVGVPGMKTASVGLQITF